MVAGVHRQSVWQAADLLLAPGNVAITTCTFSAGAATDGVAGFAGGGRSRCRPALAPAAGRARRDDAITSANVSNWLSSRAYSFGARHGAIGSMVMRAMTMSWRPVRAPTSAARLPIVCTAVRSMRPSRTSVDEPRSARASRGSIENSRRARRIVAAGGLPTRSGRRPEPVCRRQVAVVAATDDAAGGSVGRYAVGHRAGRPRLRSLHGPGPPHAACWHDDDDELRAAISCWPAPIPTTIATPKRWRLSRCRCRYARARNSGEGRRRAPRESLRRSLQQLLQPLAREKQSRLHGPFRHDPAGAPPRRGRAPRCWRGRWRCAACPAARRSPPTDVSSPLARFEVFVRRGPEAPATADDAAADAFAIGGDDPVARAGDRSRCRSSARRQVMRTSHARNRSRSRRSPEAPVGLDERFLRHVLGVLPVPQHAHRRPRNANVDDSTQPRLEFAARAPDPRLTRPPASRAVWSCIASFT